jgi:hypothetical protein
MKIASVLLGVSLAANTAFLLIVLRAPPSGASASAAVEPQPAGMVSTSAVSRGGAAMSNLDSANAVTRWEQLHPGDLPQLVARLRAAGYPSAVIRAIVSAEVSAQMSERRRELIADVEEEPYWKMGRFFSSKVSVAQRELHREQSRLMKELLGPDATDDNEISQYFRQRQYGGIPLEKVTELQRIASDYSEMRSEIYAESNGMLMPEDREKISYLEKELRSDFAKLLTPAELEEYELRSSSTANGLRSQLTTFQPNEEEFRALFQAARAVEDQFGTSMGVSTIEQMRQRQAAVSEQARLVLPPERYAEFVQATDPRYSMLNRVVARYDLPTSVVPQVYAVQQEMQERAAALRSLPAAERAEQGQALAREATAKLTPLLGERAFEAYKSYGGQWIQQLTASSTRTFGGTSATSPPMPATGQK